MSKRNPKGQPKSDQSKKQSAERQLKQALRGSSKFGGGSNPHNGGSISNSGQKSWRR